MNEEGDKMETPKNLNTYLIHQRRYFHMHPEIGFDTYQTASYIYNELKNLGYSPCYLLNKAAVVAKLILGKEKTIAFRSDMDALPIQELNTIAYKSTNSYMHACGHDAHMAILLTLAKAIREHLNEINYNITFIFQPAEEGPLPGGSKKIIETHLIDDIDAFFAYHVTNKLTSDSIGIKVGAACAAPDLFDLTITGKGCHASTPHLGKNPNLIAANIILAFEDLYQQLKEKNPFIVITTTSIISQGAYNVIPNQLMIKGTARSLTNVERDILKEKMTSIVNEIALFNEVDIQFNFYYAYDPVFNHEKLANTYMQYAKTIFHDTYYLEQPEMIGEDFSHYNQIAPICLIWLGVRKKHQPFSDLHSPNFTLDEDILIKGVLTYLEMIKGTDL